MTRRRQQSQSPWRTLNVGRPESIVITPTPEPAADSWWTPYASAETPFADFQAAAHARDVELRATSSTWRSVKANHVMDSGM
jgi:hypothetical protein